MPLTSVYIGRERTYAALSSLACTMRTRSASSGGSARSRESEAKNRSHYALARRRVCVCFLFRVGMCVCSVGFPRLAIRVGFARVCGLVWADYNIPPRHRLAGRAIFLLVEEVFCQGEEMRFL